MHIDVLTPEAKWAVIGVPIPPHSCIAVFTGKVFYRPLETHEKQLEKDNDTISGTLNYPTLNVEFLYVIGGGTH